MKKTRVGDVSKQVLVFLGAMTVMTGVVSLAVVAPGGFAGLIKLFKWIEEDKKLNKQQIRNSLNYLQRKKIVRLTYSEDKKSVKVKFSSHGLSKLKIYRLEQFGIPKPKKWDGRWRVVMFDVPEKYRTGRDMLRKTMREIGFFQLQKSVFVHPYPCEEEIELVRTNSEVRPFVKLLIATDFEGIELAMQFFEL